MAAELECSNKDVEMGIPMEEKHYIHSELYTQRRLA